MYNLKAVVKETGLKADTLRAWERRYGIPSPQRTDGGHRLYSRRDIQMIGWLMARQEEGLSISRAVELWQRLLEEGKNPLAGESRMAVTGTTSAPSGQPSSDDGDRPGAERLGELRRAWIQACVAFDEQEATRLLSVAFAMYGAESVSIDLLLRALAEIGEGWYRGELTAQQEHFASALATRRLEALVNAAPAPSRQARVLVACPPDEEHTLVPLVITLLLRRRGLDVVYLGANVPFASFEATLTTTAPNLVILTAQRLQTAASLLEIAQLLADKGVTLAFGGRVFSMLPHLQERIPGYYLGSDLNRLAASVEDLLQRRGSPTPLRNTPADHLAALEHFRYRKAFVEADLWQMAAGEPLSQQHLHRANTHFAQGIEAALRLGDMSYMGMDMGWVEELLYYHNVPTEQLEIYLRMYADAVGRQLGTEGEPIKVWLASLL